jgi:hypothetical protein
MKAILITDSQLEVEGRFLKKRVDETRCPDMIRALGVEAEYVFLLCERIDCGHWNKVSEYFRQVQGRHIVRNPVAGRKYFTVEPEKVIATMKREGLW